MATVTNGTSLGIDIGGTTINAVALKQSEIILGKLEIPSNAKAGGAEKVRDAINEAISHFTKEGIAFGSVGIGCAGSIDPIEGVVRNSPNFAGWKNVPLKEWVTKDAKVPVFLDNDANVAALGEWKLGHVKGGQNVILLTFGTGIGGGIIVNGRLYRGSTGTGGELGHFSIHADGKACPCGNRGCFERYCSASALEERVPGSSAKEIFEKQEENPFKEVVERFFDELQVGLVSIANIFDPDTLILGGAMNKSIIPRYDKIRQWIKQHAFPAIGARVKLTSTKHEKWSGAIGAALLHSQAIS